MMVPIEVVEIADLIFPGWDNEEDEANREVLKAAWRIYEAGYRKEPSSRPLSPMSGE